MFISRIGCLCTNVTEQVLKIKDLLHFQSQFNRLSHWTYVLTVGCVESLGKC